MDASRNDENKPDPIGEQATSLLGRIEDGDPLAAEKLLPLVYNQLRARAGAYFRGQLAEHSLQPTALVHEAYLRLIRSGGSWKDRSHFCAIAATAMRQILLNHARDRRSRNRPQGRVDIPIDGLSTPTAAPAVDLIALDDALTHLRDLDEADADLVELRFFTGLTVEEVARQKGVSSRTIEKRWRRVRAWLNRELGEENQN